MTVEIQYRVIEGVPGRYFTCPSGMGMLSERACAAAYREAISPIGLSEGRRISCRACRIGARHAGEPERGEAPLRFLGKNYCARCMGHASRLIRGSICVSCYNREREVLIGRNAKGGRPIFGRPVFPVMMAIIKQGGGGFPHLVGAERVTGQLELVLSLLRRESGVSFGWVGRGPQRFGG